MVIDALKFQAELGVSHYLVPALPYERPTPARLNTHRAIHELAISLIGTNDVPRRPVVAMAVPGSMTIRSPFAVFSLLSDRPFDGVYVQPMRLDPKEDSVEGLVRYLRFLEIGQQEGLRIMAGRVGVFGLLLSALGIDAFDSGLGDHEAFDLRSLTRPQREGGKGRGGQKDRRIYLPRLLTTLPESRARVVLGSKAVRAQFACEIGGCRSGFDAMIEGARSHCFHSREAELTALRSLPTRGMRIELVERRLSTALETGRAVNRMLVDDGQPTLKLEHLERWPAVLARVEERRLKETG
jgi:hypothetical protein